MGLETIAECSVCKRTFDYESEGGTCGEFGILPVAFCPTCLSSMFDMVEQRCEWCIERKDDSISKRFTAEAIRNEVKHKKSS